MAKAELPHWVKEVMNKATEAMGMGREEQQQQQQAGNVEEQSLEEGGEQKEQEGPKP